MDLSFSESCILVGTLGDILQHQACYMLHFLLFHLSWTLVILLTNHNCVCQFIVIFRFCYLLYFKRFFIYLFFYYSWFCLFYEEEMRKDFCVFVAFFSLKRTCLFHVPIPANITCVCSSDHTMPLCTVSLFEFCPWLKSLSETPPLTSPFSLGLFRLILGDHLMYHFFVETFPHIIRKNKSDSNISFTLTFFILLLLLC